MRWLQLAKFLRVAIPAAVNPEPPRAEVQCRVAAQRCDNDLARRSRSQSDAAAQPVLLATGSQLAGAVHESSGAHFMTLGIPRSNAILGVAQKFLAKVALRPALLVGLAGFPLIRLVLPVHAAGVSFFSLHRMTPRLASFGYTITRVNPIL